MSGMALLDNTYTHPRIISLLVLVLIFDYGSASCAETRCQNRFDHTGCLNVLDRQVAKAKDRFLTVQDIVVKMISTKITGMANFHRMNRQQSINRVLERAKEVFGDPKKAREWMNTPNLALGNKPIALLETEEGEGTVLGVLNSIETGGVV